MARFHVNPNTGNSSACKASKSGCPFGGESGSDNHFDTPEAAQQAAEKLMSEQFSNVKTAYRKKDSSVVANMPREIKKRILEEASKSDSKIHPSVVAKVFSKDNDELIRKNVAERFKSQKILREMSDDESARVRLGVAKSTNNREVLAALANDPDSKVRSAALANKNIPVKAKKLAQAAAREKNLNNLKKASEAKSNNNSSSNKEDTDIIYQVHVDGMSKSLEFKTREEADAAAEFQHKIGWKANVGRVSRPSSNQKPKSNSDSSQKTNLSKEQRTAIKKKQDKKLYEKVFSDRTEYNDGNHINLDDAVAGYKAGRESMLTENTITAQGKHTMMVTLSDNTFSKSEKASLGFKDTDKVVPFVSMDAKRNVVWGTSGVMVNDKLHYLAETRYEVQNGEQLETVFDKEITGIHDKAYEGSTNPNGFKRELSSNPNRIKKIEGSTTSLYEEMDMEF